MNKIKFATVIFLMLIGVIQVFSSVRLWPDNELFENYLIIANREQLIESIIAERDIRRDTLTGFAILGGALTILSSIMMIFERK